MGGRPAEGERTDVKKREEVETTIPRWAGSRTR